MIPGDIRHDSDPVLPCANACYTIWLYQKTTDSSSSGFVRILPRMWL